MLNILTIDLEDYFQVHAFSSVIRYEDWDNYECRIERNTDRLLDVLSSSLRTPHSALRTPIKATFFVLGWIAERYSGLVQRIQKEGHEIACHGYAHKLIYTQSKEEFRQDIRKSKAILEDITGSEVIGYRAPSYSITDKSRWAFEVLVEEGFQYDSSIFPIHHDFYGMPNAPRFPFIISLNGTSNFEFSMLNFSNAFTHSLINPCSDVSEPQHGSPAAPLEGITPNSELRTPNYLLEFPISTAKLLGQNVPLSGGGYFRFLPYSIVKRGLNRINKKEGQPFIFYLHPWEIDPEQPRINGLSSRSNFRHYVNLDKTEFKFKKLLFDFEFSSIKQLLRDNGSTG